MPARRPSPPAWSPQWVPTPRQVLVLGACVQFGRAETAARLSMTDDGVDATLAAMRDRAGVESTEQLIYVGAVTGWLVLPDLARGRAHARATLSA